MAMYNTRKRRQHPNMDMVNLEELVANSDITEETIENLLYSCRPKETTMVKDMADFPCSKCSYTTWSSSNLSKHKRKHAAVKSHSCPVSGCTYATRYPANVYKHMRSHMDDRDWICTECGKGFKTRSALLNHSLIHSDEKPLACPICPYRCKRRWELTSHRLKHTNARPFPCTQCTHHAKCRSDLNKHIAGVHASASERVACPQCERSFPHSKSLAKHVQCMHTERARVPCDRCAQTFTSAAGLRRHVLTIHARVRPFHCDVCKRRFATRGNMLLHKRVHDADRKHKCSLCQYGARELQHLYAHVGSAHPGTRMHYCELCHSDFAYKHQLRQHTRTRKHQDNVRFTKQPVDAEIDAKSKKSRATRSSSSPVKSKSVRARKLTRPADVDDTPIEATPADDTPVDTAPVDTISQLEPGEVNESDRSEIPSDTLDAIMKTETEWEDDEERSFAMLRDLVTLV